MSWITDSRATWQTQESREPAVPDELVVPTEAPVRERLAAWRRRHLFREAQARQNFAASKNPDRALPVSGRDEVVEFVRRLFGHRKLFIAFMIIANGLTALVGVLVPQALGDIVDQAAGSGTPMDRINQLSLGVAGLVVLQAFFTFWARFTAAVFGQDVLAEAREHVVDTVLALPLGRVEQASTGDLVTRITRDVGAMSEAVRQGLPQFFISGATVLFTIVAMVINSPLLSLPMLVLVALSMIQVRRYLQRSPAGYVMEGATYSDIGTTLTETVEGARTVEALGLQRARIARGDDDIARSAQAERYTMSLRNLMFIVMDVCCSAPRAFTIGLGAVGYVNGWVTLGQITAAMLYIETLIIPIDWMIQTLDRLQVGVASISRLLGIAGVPADREPGRERPRGSHLVGRDLRFAYREGHDVLHGVDLDLQPGERLAVVGPSGSGKSTLGRLLSGINGPRTGAVTVGGVELVKLPLDVLRTQVALVTQEHHVFVGSVRDNIVLAREDSSDETVRQALAAVDALGWVDRLPQGLDTLLGTGHHGLTPAQAQQIALARLVVADPHTLVLDEATSLIDPHTARHMEGSMSALLTGRTVVAIAHRLHTAHDADRIAVVIDGRIVELGSHDELVVRGGEYAKLWQAWTS
ncbi:ABC transporter ATP-binding protein [Propionibacteriaceae bacterium Y1685]